MFQGETAVTLDDKGRVSIPATHREAVAKLSGNRLVATYNPFEHGSTSSGFRREGVDVPLLRRSCNTLCHV